MKKTQRNSLRKLSGTSIVEILVATVVLGVAIAGISDLLWMNTSWTRNFLNKTGASYASESFLKRLREDLNSAYRISQESDAQKLIFWAPSSLDTSSANPFPPAASASADKVTYQLVGNTITKSSGGKTWTVLKGVVGPKKIGSADITVFQYVPKVILITDPDFGVKANASSGARCVLVDIEVLNRDYGKSKSSESDNPLTSDIMLREEFFARNELGLDP